MVKTGTTCFSSLLLFLPWKPTLILVHSIKYHKQMFGGSIKKEQHQYLYLSELMGIRTFSLLVCKVITVVLLVWYYNLKIRNFIRCFIVYNLSSTVINTFSCLQTVQMSCQPRDNLAPLHRRPSVSTSEQF